MLYPYKDKTNTHRQTHIHTSSSDIGGSDSPSLPVSDPFRDLLVADDLCLAVEGLFLLEPTVAFLGGEPSLLEEGERKQIQARIIML